MPSSTETTFTCETCGGTFTVPGKVQWPPSDSWIIVTYKGKQYLFHTATCAAAWLATKEGEDG